MSLRKLVIVATLAFGVSLLLSACAGTAAGADFTETPTVQALSIQTFVPATPTATATALPTATAIPKPTATATATPRPVVHQQPTATPVSCQYVNCNPWGYNFSCCNFIYSPPANFCAYFSCIPSFWKYTNGYVEECKDGMFSHSGGRSGSCSSHGGNWRPLYSH